MSACLVLSPKPAPSLMACWAVALCLMTSSLSLAQPQARPYANQYDLEREAVFAAREADWRNGTIVYQVIVDRFAPPDDLEAKRHLYPEPKRLRAWDEVPRKGQYVEEVEVWSHEIDFWGGDLQSLISRLDYLQQLGVEVLYLNPIHMAYTNHKYDAQDYFAISPEYGSREDVIALARELHRRHMRLVLDGVFNHMGRTSPAFQSALNDPSSIWRDWFYIGPQYQHGYRAWYNVANLPELNLENPVVQARVFGDADSVIQGYLRDGVDGWRLDVAFDIGFSILTDLTRSAHTARPGSLVVGEIWNYPQEWTPALDAVMNMHWRRLILDLARGDVSAPQAARMINRLVEDMGIEPLLKSWMVLDNHDTPRLRTVLPEAWQQRFAQALQFTLPGAPNVYYGVEVGMQGGDDPEQRGPMRWDLATDDNEYMIWMRQLIELRDNSRALRIGDFVPLDAQHTVAFIRRTDRVAEAKIIIANPSSEPVEEYIAMRDGKIMDWARLVDHFTGESASVHAGILRVTIPPRTVRVFGLQLPEPPNYSPYKRVQ